MIEVENMINMTTHYYGDEFRKIVNMTDEEIQQIIKNITFSYNPYNIQDKTQRLPCGEDAEKYCDGTMKNLASAYKNIHG